MDDFWITVCHLTPVSNPLLYGVALSNSVHKHDKMHVFFMQTASIM